MRVTLPLFVSCCLLSPAAIAQPVVTFTDTAARVSAVTPGGSVAVIAVLHEPRGYIERITTVAELATDADRDGVAEVSLGRPISRESVWLAVDVMSGLRAVAAPKVVQMQAEPLATGGERITRRGEYLTFHPGPPPRRCVDAHRRGQWHP